MTRFDLIWIVSTVGIAIWSSRRGLGTMIGIIVGGLLGSLPSLLFDIDPPNGLHVLLAFIMLALGLGLGAWIGTTRLQSPRSSRWASAALGVLACSIGTWLVIVPLSGTPGALRSVFEDSLVVDTFAAVPSASPFTRPADLLSALATEYDRGGPSPTTTTSSSTTSIKVPFPERPDGISSAVHSRIVHATVRIFSAGCLAAHSATGFAVDGGILTNSHVVEGAETVQVATWDGHLFVAKILAYDPVNELALLSNSKHEAKPDLSFTADKINAKGWLYGYGDNATLSATRITLRGAADGPAEGTQDRRFQGVVRRGDSGAPLVTANGKVMGINWARETDSVNVGRARPSEAIETFLRTRPKNDASAICKQPVEGASEE